MVTRYNGKKKIEMYITEKELEEIKQITNVTKESLGAFVRRMVFEKLPTESLKIKK